MPATHVPAHVDVGAEDATRPAQRRTPSGASSRKGKAREPSPPPGSASSSLHHLSFDEAEPRSASSASTKASSPRSSKRPPNPRRRTTDTAAQRRRSGSSHASSPPGSPASQQQRHSLTTAFNDPPAPPSNPPAPVQVNPPMPPPAAAATAAAAVAAASRSRSGSGRRARPAPAASGPASTPAPDEFAFSSLMADLLKDPAAAAELDAIARICGRSHLSRANEYAAHREPVGAGVHVVGVDGAAGLDESLAALDLGDGSMHPGVYAPAPAAAAAAHYSLLETVAEAQGDEERAAAPRRRGWGLLGGVFQGGAPGRAQATVGTDVVAAEGAGSWEGEEARRRLMRLAGTS